MMMVEFSGQDIQYLATVLQQRPLAEALPMWLKLTGQRLVRDTDKQPGEVVNLVKPGAE